MGVLQTLWNNGRRALHTLHAERRCPVCLTPFVPSCADDAGSLPLCPHCTAALTRTSRDHCPLCGVTLPDAGAHPHPCPRCLAEPPPWTHFAFACNYDALAKDVVLRFKFRQDFTLTETMGALLYIAVRRLPPADVCVPMPQHIQRLRERGFNPVLDMSRAAARRAGLPLLPHGLRRTRYVPPQESLSSAERRDNPQDSFAASNVRGLRVALVDDVLTTGATMRHAAQCLLRYGAADVFVAVATRTQRHD